MCDSVIKYTRYISYPGRLQNTTSRFYLDSLPPEKRMLVMSFLVPQFHWLHGYALCHQHDEDLSS